MEDYIQKAKKGRTYWLDLVLQYHIDENMAVVLVVDESDLELAVKCIPKYIEKKQISKILLLIPESAGKENLQDIYGCGYLEVLSDNQMDDLLKFYGLYNFFPGFIIASLTKPPGRMGMGYLKKDGITYDEIFRTVVFDLGDK